ncbi:transglycosylase domain-containing protein [Thermopolyspora sp. NPDC052614]|uniref:transglycosylase domain-containing protein n=1 Tax=Thermopolyspora sp. NPDC052614 TaxID=3155682 RepID=UPI0034469D95
MIGGIEVRDGERKRGLGRRVLRIVLIAFGVGTIAAVAAFAVAWVLTPIPDDAQPRAVAQKSVIYYRDGKTVLATQGVVNRTRVPLARVPEHVRNAIIAAENRSFYEDQGISLSGTARAMWSTLTGQQLQGGSTITQQMVRNYYSGLSQERSIGRKLKEILISLKVDQSKPKDWVLEQYVNTIYFGRGAYGVQAAAQAYFGKNVGALTVAEGAYLAAVIQQPSRFADPKGAELETARARWAWVIDSMRQTGALSAAEAAAQKYPKLREPPAALSLNGQKGHVLAQVRAELNRRGYTDEEINQGGLRITTTFDKTLMAAARQAVESVLPRDTPKKVRTGLAAVDPATGEVLAFYGGKGYQYDNAFSAKVQAGSTFKPYTLAAALEAGYGLGTRVNGNSPMRVASALIPNSGGTSYGSAIDLVTATRNSVNTAFVDLGQRVGLDKVAAAAQAAGIPAEQLAPHQAAATLPLGVASVSAVQQASGFGVFAAEGLYYEPHVIRSIKDASGAVHDVAVQGRRVFRPETAADTTYALTQVVEAGTGTSARLPDRPAAGKTGTTDKSASVWFVGYTPQLSTAVNMFRDDNKPVAVPGYGELYGGSLPAQIWRAFMTEAMAGLPVEQFPEPTFYQSAYDPFQDEDDLREDEDPEDAVPDDEEETGPPVEESEPSTEPVPEGDELGTGGEEFDQGDPGNDPREGRGLVEDDGSEGGLTEDLPFGPPDDGP